MSFPFVPLREGGLLAPALGPTTWMESAALQAGMVGEFMAWDPSLSNPLMPSGAMLFACEAAFKLEAGRRDLEWLLTARPRHACPPA